MVSVEPKLLVKSVITRVPSPVPMLQGDCCMELDHGVVYSTAAAMQRINTNIRVMFAMTHTVSYKDMLTAEVEL